MVKYSTLTNWQYSSTDYKHICVCFGFGFVQDSNETPTDIGSTDSEVNMIMCCIFVCVCCCPLFYSAIMYLALPLSRSTLL